MRSCDSGDTVGSLQALGALHDSCLAATKKSQQEALLAPLQQLLRSLQDPSCPSYSAAALLEVLSHVNGEVRPLSTPVSGVTVGLHLPVLGPGSHELKHCSVKRNIHIKSSRNCNMRAKALGGDIPLKEDHLG